MTNILHSTLSYDPSELLLQLNSGDVKSEEFCKFQRALPGHWNPDHCHCAFWLLPHLRVLRNALMTAGFAGEEGALWVACALKMIQLKAPLDDGTTPAALYLFLSESPDKFDRYGAIAQEYADLFRCYAKAGLVDVSAPLPGDVPGEWKYSDLVDHRRNGPSGLTPLAWAIISADTILVDVLLELGAQFDIGAVEKGGESFNALRFVQHEKWGSGGRREELEPIIVRHAMSRNLGTVMPRRSASHGVTPVRRAAI